MKNIEKIKRKLEQLIKYSELLGYYHANKHDIDVIINDIYNLKTEIIYLILDKKKEDIE